MGQTTWPLHGNDFYPVASRKYSLVAQSQSQTILPHALWMTLLRDAKIILTVRDNIEVWHKPVTDTLWAGHFAFAFGVPKSAYQAFMQLHPEASCH
jgi:hypothetical protein